MVPTPPALAYRRAATQQASVVGLVIALYDTLAGDLQRAKAAMDRQNIEARCEQLKHGFAVLTQLDALVDLERGGDAAINLQRFYRHLRAEMLRAQFVQEGSILSHLATLLLDVRGAWHEVDTRAALPEHPGQTADSELSGISEKSAFSCLA